MNTNPFHPLRSDGAHHTVVLGGFDGVHPGHMALLHTAKELLAPVTVYTFTNLPKTVPALTQTADRTELLLANGADRVVLDQFAAVRSMSPEQFVRRLLIGTLNCGAVVCGFNYRFGVRASGDTDTLRALLSPHGIPLHVVDAVTVDGAPVSSTRIRRHLGAGELETANRLLSRPFFYRLPVLHGQKLGRTVGMPTANQRIPAHLILLPKGVYATCVQIGGTLYPAMTNIGSRPTVNLDESDVTCETHILGFEGDLYGRMLKVEFLSRLRGEMTFPDLMALRAQTQTDADQALSCFRERSHA